MDLKKCRPSSKVLLQSGAILVGTFILVLIMEIQKGVSKEEITCIKRNSYEDGVKLETLEMQIEGEHHEKVILQISPRFFSEQEIEVLFSEAIKEIEIEMLGENESIVHVTKDLSFPNALEGFPFMISWQLSRYDVLDMSGRIVEDRLSEVDPNGEGVLVGVTAVLKWEEKELSKSFDVNIFLEDAHEKGMKDVVLEVVSELNNTSREEPYITLPSEVNGKQIVWCKESETNSFVIVLLGISASSLVLVLEEQKKKETESKRKEQMIFDYPEIISQFIILMGAGMTVKNAWKKMVEDYQKQKREDGKVRWAYEEMEYTLKEMQNGVPELDCYERFAKKCDLMPYIKLGALLAQNLKKGTKGLWIQLELEAHQAMNDRKNQIKRIGEEAGTKLLVPMLLMLIVVLMIVIVPAFLSIQL